ncbi:MAG: substrate-binding periplasmic protein [Eubacterium sp.]
MKSLKKALAFFLCAVTVAFCFAGCSKSEEATEITDETMLIAYTEEKAPFIYTENGELTGFDVEVFKKIFDDIKNDYKNYQFVKVDKDYKVGEDAAYTDEEGNEYIAYVMIGGVEKNTGSFNEDYTFSEDVIDNRIIAVGYSGNSANQYTFANIDGVKAGVVSDVAKTALDKNAAVKGNMKSVKDYSDAASALADLKAGKIDVLIIDEFNFNTVENKDEFYVFNGELDTISYVYSFKKWDWYVDSINEAIYELQSDQYNDADEFTPIVEKYFGYDASSFDYQPSQEK